MSDDEHGHEALRAALEALPVVEKVERGVLGEEWHVHLETDFAPPVVLGTIAAHGWGVMDASMRVVHAAPHAPRPPEEVSD